MLTKRNLRLQFRKIFSNLDRLISNINFYQKILDSIRNQIMSHNRKIIIRTTKHIEKLKSLEVNLYKFNSLENLF